MANKTIQCKLCNKLLGNLINHIKFIHKITCKEYKLMFPGEIVSKSWSEGLTKETDIRIKKMSEKLSGKIWSKERNEKISKSHQGKKRSIELKEAIRQGELRYYKNNPEAGKIKNEIMHEGLNSISKKKTMNKPETILFNTIQKISGLLPKYNYKVGMRYIDVALIEFQIGFECDGEYWHKDKLADQNRDTQLYDLGWRIYRFPSQMLFHNLTLVEERIKEILDSATICKEMLNKLLDKEELLVGLQLWTY